MNLILLLSSNGVIYKFQSRQNIVPFEAAFALFSIYSSLVGMLNFGVIPNAFNTALGATFTVISNILFLVSGSCIYIGVGFARRDLEALGIIVLISCLLTRMLLIGLIMGVDTVVFNNYVYNSIFIVACAIRLNTLLRKHLIIRLDDSPNSIKIEYGQHNSAT